MATDELTDEMKDKFGYELTGDSVLQVENIRKDESVKKLNFGCGDDIREGWDNLDIWDFNFNEFPYPIKSNTYDYILCKMVLEHIFDVKGVLHELWRISRKGAEIEIIVPYFNGYGSFSDVEHIHHFNDRAFKTNLKMESYFNVKEVKLIPSKLGLFFPFRNALSRYISGLVKQIYVRLEVKK